jgi:protein-disulfide isomerase
MNLIITSRAHVTLLAAQLLAPWMIHLNAAEACTNFDTTVSRRVAGYIHQRYKLPVDVHLLVTDGGLVGNTCFRRMRISSSNPDVPFAQLFFLAPGQQLVTSSLFDLRVDPDQDQRQRRDELQRRVTAGARPVLGAAEAKLQIAVFSDFECPYCREAAATVKDLVLSRPDDVALVYRYFPLPSHAWARSAAEASACMYQQGPRAFWHFHDELYKRQEEITSETFLSESREIASSTPGVSMAAFTRCVDSHATAGDVESDVQLGLENEVTSTPTLVIGGFLLPGVRQRNELNSIIDGVLSGLRHSSAH